MSNKPIAEAWTFESSSGGEYQTLRYKDGSTSCECRGWCRRVAPDGSRSCKHTRYVEMGLAHSRSIAHTAYGQVTVSVPVTVRTVKHPGNQPSTIPHFGVTKRKFAK